MKQHEKSVKHQKAVNESKSQVTLGYSKTGSITVSKSFLQDQVNLQQLIAKAEIIQALHVVESNQSFRSTNKDPERFREQANVLRTMMRKANVLRQSREAI